jgi:hypothetical protein
VVNNREETQTGIWKLYAGAKWSSENHLTFIDYEWREILICLFVRVYDKISKSTLIAHYFWLYKGADLKFLKNTNIILKVRNM